MSFHDQELLDTKQTVLLYIFDIAINGGQSTKTAEFLCYYNSNKDDCTLQPASVKCYLLFHVVNLNLSSHEGKPSWRLVKSLFYYKLKDQTMSEKDPLYQKL